MPLGFKLQEKEDKRSKRRKRKRLAYENRFWKGELISKRQIKVNPKEKDDRKQEI